MKTEKIALLGGGNMGRALIGGLIRRGTRAKDISVGEASETARSSLQQDFGVTVSSQNVDAVADASLVIVAVKPQSVAAALAPLADVIRKNHALVLSVAAGIKTIAIETLCGAGVPVVRAMPNRPALVGAGVTGLFANSGVQAAERARAEQVMHSAGEVVWVQREEHIDVVTAVSGSGPAYFFLLAEAMTQAAVDLGLDANVARQLAIGTLHGSGVLARESHGDLAQLRAEVTSKGGTTEAALRTLEAAEFRKIVARAVEAAAKRSGELAAHFGGNR